MPPKVFLVGAGPGDPELLTLKAARLLGAADVVLYDQLVSDGVLSLARPGARLVDVGKRCGRHSMQQEAINRLILRCAREGGTVVRLKGGDPFVFGRGGEEADFLRAHGCAVEIVPGITAALAAASSLAAPLTYRGVARSLHIVTGHRREGDAETADWSRLADTEGTLAIYMGKRMAPVIAAELMAGGLAGDTPAVAVENASLPSQRECPATLATLADAVSQAGFDGPTLLLVGRALAHAPAMVKETKSRAA